MANLKIWDRQEGFSLPNGVFYTVQQIYEKYPFTKSGTVVLEYLPNGNVGAIDDLEILKQVFNVDMELSGNEALTAIIEAKEALANAVHVDPVEAKLDYIMMMIG